MISSRYTMRTISCRVALGLMLALAGSAGSGRASVRPRSSGSITQLSVLYAVNAGAAKLTRVPAHPGQVILTIARIQPQAFWSSTGSDRRSGALRAGALASSWRAYGFASHPPQAVLSYTDPRQGPGRALTLKLGAPTVTRSGLSFRARVLDPRSITRGPLAALAERASLTLPPSLQDLSLLINALRFPVMPVIHGPERLDGCLLVGRIRCPGVRILNFTWGTPPISIFGALFAPPAPVNLYEADLAHADLAGDTLWGIQLGDSDLVDADLAHTDLGHVNLIDANLTGADLIDANVGGAQLAGANLSGANLTGATASVVVADPDGKTSVEPIPISSVLEPARLCHTISPTGQQLNRDCR